jgi:AcrR family transcriptional regulator
MARPKSEDKRNAILAAAAKVIGEQGESAPTAKIAREAGVAEGTLFTYFATKDALLNALYTDIKTDLGAAMLAAYPTGGTVRERLHHAWSTYVDWSVRHPVKRKVMAQLGMSQTITEETKAALSESFSYFNGLLGESMAKGKLRDQSTSFVVAIMGSLVETTMDFIAREPDQAARYRESGFEAFWNAVAL